MELRERIARAVVPHLYYMFSEWEESDDENRETALEIADDVTADRLWVDHITPRLGIEGGNDD